MTDFANLNGQDRIIAGEVTVPWRGTPMGDVTIATANTIPQVDVVNIGNLQLNMDAFFVSNFGGSRSVRLDGGNGGWKKPVAAQSYYSPTGVLASMVLRDVAALVNETINIPVDVNLGPFFIRPAGAAQQVLELLSGALWYIDPAGVTQINTPRNTAAITTPWLVEKLSGGKGLYTVATEDYASWLPGRTFLDPVIGVTLQVSMSAFRMLNNGNVRVEVLTV